MYYFHISSQIKNNNNNSDGLFEFTHRLVTEKKYEEKEEKKIEIKKS